MPRNRYACPVSGVPATMSSKPSPSTSPTPRTLGNSVGSPRMWPGSGTGEKFRPASSCRSRPDDVRAPLFPPGRARRRRRDRRRSRRPPLQTAARREKTKGAAGRTCLPRGARRPRRQASRPQRRAERSRNRQSRHRCSRRRMPPKKDSLLTWTNPVPVPRNGLVATASGMPSPSKSAPPARTNLSGMMMSGTSSG